MGYRGFSHIRVFHINICVFVSCLVHLCFQCIDRLLDCGRVRLNESISCHLVSVGQIVDQGMEVQFTHLGCFIEEEGRVFAQGRRDERMFILDSTDGGTAMFAKGQKLQSDIDLWHKQMGHVNYKQLQDLESKQVVFGLPKFSGRKAQICEPSQRERESKYIEKLNLKICSISMYTCVCSMNTLYTSPRRTNRSTIVLQCSLNNSTLTPKIYSLRNIFPNGLPVSAPNRPSFAPICVSVLGLGLTDRSQPIRSSACSADAADVELVSQHH